MKKYLNEYPDKAAYEADEARKNLNASTVSLIGKDVIKDGVNVEVEVPSLGDAVYHDGDKKVRFIKYGTIVKESLPSDFIPIGVCGPYNGPNIYIIDSRTENLKMAEYMHFKVSGWKLDGISHSGKIEFYDTSIDKEFSYNATTIESCCEQLNSFLRANYLPDKPYIAYMKDNDVIMQCMNYNTYKDYKASISGLTVTLLTMQEISQCPKAFLKSGDEAYPVWNLNRAIEYLENDNTSSAYNPTSVVKSMPTYPTCLPAYLGTSIHRDGDMCAYLRERFGEGRVGWVNYLKQRFMINPYPKGMASEEYGTGKINTYKLAGYKLLNETGVEVSQYPAADFSANKGYKDVLGLEKGDWFVPSAPEYFSIFELIEYGNKGATVESDKINYTLSKMGLPSLSCYATSWLMSRFSASHSWFAFSTGYIDTNLFYIRDRVVSVALYPINRKVVNI